MRVSMMPSMSMLRRGLAACFVFAGASGGQCLRAARHNDETTPLRQAFDGKLDAVHPPTLTTSLQASGVNDLDP
jgi:hypothetical protein